MEGQGFHLEGQGLCLGQLFFNELGACKYMGLAKT